MLSKIKEAVTSLIDINKLKKSIPILQQLNLDQVTGSGSGQSPGRPMKFPYTFSAKIAQFPYKFYMNKNWMYRYYPLGVLVALPAFVVCHRLANTPNNKRVWAEIRAKEANPHHEEEYLMLDEEQEKGGTVLNPDPRCKADVNEEEKCGCHDE